MPKSDEENYTTPAEQVLHISGDGKAKKLRKKGILKKKKTPKKPKKKKSPKKKKVRVVEGEQIKDATGKIMTKEQIDKIISRRLAGESVWEISRDTNLSTQKIYRILRGVSIPRKGKDEYGPTGAVGRRGRRYRTPVQSAFVEQLSSLAKQVDRKGAPVVPPQRSDATTAQNITRPAQEAFQGVVHPSAMKASRLPTESISSYMASMPVQYQEVLKKLLDQSAAGDTEAKKLLNKAQQEMDKRKTDRGKENALYKVLFGAQLIGIQRAATEVEEAMEAEEIYKQIVKDREQIRKARRQRERRTRPPRGFQMPPAEIEMQEILPQISITPPPPTPITLATQTEVAERKRRAYATTLLAKIQRAEQELAEIQEREYKKPKAKETAIRRAEKKLNALKAQLLPLEEIIYTEAEMEGEPGQEIPLLRRERGDKSNIRQTIEYLQAENIRLAGEIEQLLTKEQTEEVVASIAQKQTAINKNQELIAELIAEEEAPQAAGLTHEEFMQAQLEGQVGSGFKLQRTAPDYVQAFIDQHRNWSVVKIQVGRTALEKELTKAINVAMLGQLRKKLDKLHIDDLFHTFLIITIKLGNRTKEFILEKNERIYLFPKAQEPEAKKIELMNVPMAYPILLGTFFLNGEKAGGKEHYVYHPINANCQWFVRNMLSGNGLLTRELDRFTMQPIKHLIPKWMQKVGTFATSTQNLITKAFLEPSAEDVKGKGSNGIYRRGGEDADQTTPQPTQDIEWAGEDQLHELRKLIAYAKDQLSGDPNILFQKAQKRAIEYGQQRALAERPSMTEAEYKALVAKSEGKLAETKKKVEEKTTEEEDVPKGNGYKLKRWGYGRDYSFY